MRGENRRQFIKALGGATAVFGAKEADAQEPSRLAQAQPSATPQSDSAPRPLPRVHLMIGPGTLPSVGKDRMDLLRYRLSGIPRMTGEQMLGAAHRHTDKKMAHRLRPATHTG